MTSGLTGVPSKHTVLYMLTSTCMLEHIGVACSAQLSIELWIPLGESWRREPAHMDSLSCSYDSSACHGAVGLGVATLTVLLLRSV